MDKLNDSLYGDAAKYFEKLEARYPYGRYAQQAQIDIAYAYYKDEEPEMALAACDRFLKLHPDHPDADYVYYLRGIIHFNENQDLMTRFFPQDMSERDPRAAIESYEAFKQLVDRFPDSKYTPDARARMKYLVNALALHEVHVASYYVRRGDYVAAVDRAQYAIDHYPDTPAIEEALAIMVRAYGALGMDGLRDDSQRILVKNFPDTRYKNGYRDARDPWWQVW